MSGGSDTQSTKFDPPDWTKDEYPGFVEAAKGLAQNPYQPFMGQVKAEVNPWQMTAGQQTLDKSLYGDPGTNAARGSNMAISQGLLQNPYGDNAHTEQMIRDTAGNMTDSYLGGDAMNMSALAAKQGAFGGSGHTQAMQSGAANLAKQVGQMGTATRQSEIGRKGQLWNADVGNMLQANSQAPGFSQLDTQNFDSLMKYGSFFQDDLQKQLDQRKSLFDEQQGNPYKMLDWFGSKLGQASGQYGQNFQQGPGQSGLLNGIGAASSLYGLMG
jgi:hypothetical protein